MAQAGIEPWDLETRPWLADPAKAANQRILDQKAMEKMFPEA
jgi:hypothetical protein